MPGKFHIADFMRCSVALEDEMRTAAAMMLPEFPVPAARVGALVYVFVPGIPIR